METSGNSLTTSSQLLTVNNYDPLALVSAWRYLGQGVLPNLNTRTWAYAGDYSFDTYQGRQSSS